MNKEKLIPQLDVMSEEGFADVLIAVAANIEGALMLTGAEPGKDYSRKDLFTLAQPYVLDWFNSEESATKNAALIWPANEVHEQRH